MIVRTQNLVSNITATHHDVRKSLFSYFKFRISSHVPEASESNDLLSATIPVLLTSMNSQYYASGTSIVCFTLANCDGVMFYVMRSVVENPLRIKCWKVG